VGKEHKKLLKNKLSPVSRKWSFRFFVFVIILLVAGIQTGPFQEEPQTEIFVEECSRSFTQDSLCITLKMSSNAKTAITTKCKLIIPIEFVERMKSDGVYEETPYMLKATKGIESNWFTIDNGQSKECVFEIPVKTPFIESEWYDLIITWNSWQFPFGMTTNTRTIRITPFEEVEPEPEMVMDNGFSIAYDPDGEPRYPDIRATAVSLVYSSLYKGDQAHARITVRNYGTGSGTPYLNVQVKELSGLYIGFDRGVWSAYGNGVSGGSTVSPGYSKTYDFYFGPILYDSNRGIWALNGRRSYVDASVQTMSYRIATVRVKSYYGGSFWATRENSFTTDFTVSQHPTTPRILTAVVDDEYFTYNPATFCEEAVDFPLRIGSPTYTGPQTTFEALFGLDFRFYDVGDYDWPWYQTWDINNWEALQVTRSALGDLLSLGCDWVSAGVNIQSSSIEDMAGTMRENHGFDLGLGLFYAYNGPRGMSYQNGNYHEVIGAWNWDHYKECLIHEICHGFSARHGDQYPTKFGPYEDGLTYVMGGGDGNDFNSWTPCWRMNPQVETEINGEGHLRQYNGAAPPSGLYGYGQWRCYAPFGLETPQYQIYRLSSSSSYVQGNGGSLFTRFNVIEGHLGSPDPVPTWWRVTEVDANIVYPNVAYFYVAYHMQWSSDHWPTGFSPANGMDFWYDIELYHYAKQIISSVTNVDIKINSGLTGTVTNYYSRNFLSNNPQSGSGEDITNCYRQWGHARINPINIADADGNVYFLVGFYDCWSYDWLQRLDVHPQFMQFEYNLGTW